MFVVRCLVEIWHSFPMYQVPTTECFYFIGPFIVVSKIIHSIIDFIPHSHCSTLLSMRHPHMHWNSFFSTSVLWFFGTINKPTLAWWWKKRIQIDTSYIAHWIRTNHLYIYSRMSVFEGSFFDSCSLLVAHSISAVISYEWHVMHK